MTTRVTPLPDSAEGLPVGYAIRPGNPMPFGASVLPDGVNFSIFSRHATGCTLLLFDLDQVEPFLEIPLPQQYRIGDVYAITVLGVNHHKVEYGFRLDGPWSPEQGHRFDQDCILLDPYAKAIGGRKIWGTHFDPKDPFQHRARILADGIFDWGEDRPLARPIEDCVIYEMHVRGFTRHPSSGVADPGTYAAIREKIPYLKDLGVNCIELMPIFEFDEFEHSREVPETGELLLNYWGYSPIAFFAPKSGYACSQEPSGEANELKSLIKDLHANGFEVILDVVFNHTAEGNDQGPTISYKGIDNSIYYILTPDGYFYNFSGTGNTFNCNHPRVRNLIIDCLRYWVAEYHVDGFRFDLASIMTRDVNGMPLLDPPLLREMVDDPVLSRTKLIAEPWDADGLYHLGSFPAYDRWAEWNGRYRDTMRTFLKGDRGHMRAVAHALMGSPDLYAGRGPIATINFITAHDGFTLMDLVSYNDKHNEANHEPGDNGTNNNNSWNHGAEGPTDDPEINTLRRRQIKNALAMLMVSQGVPMILMGDEIGRTQQGNNNAYNQDNELSWMNWSLVEDNGDILRFFKACIAFRNAHSSLRNGHFLRQEDHQNRGCADLIWHGLRPEKPNWAVNSHTLAFTLCGSYGKGALVEDDDIYVAMNMHWKDHVFELPQPREGRAWHVFANTGDLNAPVHEPNEEPLLPNQQKILLRSRSVVILVGK